MVSVRAACQFVCCSILSTEAGAVRVSPEVLRKIHRGESANLDGVWQSLHVIALKDACNEDFSFDAPAARMWRADPEQVKVFVCIWLRRKGYPLADWLRENLVDSALTGKLLLLSLGFLTARAGWFGPESLSVLAACERAANSAQRLGDREDHRVQPGEMSVDVLSKRLLWSYGRMNRGCSRLSRSSSQAVRSALQVSDSLPPKRLILAQGQEVVPLRTLDWAKKMRVPHPDRIVQGEEDPAELEAAFWLWLIACAESLPPPPLKHKFDGLHFFDRSDTADDKDESRDSLHVPLLGLAELLSDAPRGPLVKPEPPPLLSCTCPSPQLTAAEGEEARPHFYLTRREAFDLSGKIVAAEEEIARLESLIRRLQEYGDERRQNLLDRVNSLGSSFAASLGGEWRAPPQSPSPH